MRFGSKKAFFSSAVFSLGVCGHSSVVSAGEQSKIEIGGAIGSQYLADYRGSNEYNFRAVPVPFFVYRGDRFRVDRSGVRGDLFSSRRWELNVSGEVSLSGGRDDNEARQGMPELDSTFEIGPSLNFGLTGDVRDDGLLLRLPVRAVTAASFDNVEYVGYLFNPKFTYRNSNIGRGWRFSANLGATFGSESYHDYYYTVDPEFVTASRPAYQAKEGYSGLYFKSGLSRRSGSWRYGMSVRYDNLSGTDFSNNSPLVETDDYFAVSFLIARYFWASDD